MSFDLAFVDRPMARDSAMELYEQMESVEDEVEPLTPRLAAAVAELEATFVGMSDEDMEFDDDCPWASWPLDCDRFDQGRGLSLNIRWSAVETALQPITEIGLRHGLIVVDLQDEEVLYPHLGPNAEVRAKAESPAGSRWRRIRDWFGRR